MADLTDDKVKQALGLHDCGVNSSLKKQIIFSKFCFLPKIFMSTLSFGRLQLGPTYRVIAVYKNGSY